MVDLGNEGDDYIEDYINVAFIMSEDGQGDFSAMAVTRKINDKHFIINTVSGTEAEDLYNVLIGRAKLYQDIRK